LSFAIIFDLFTKMGAKIIMFIFAKN